MRVQQPIPRLGLQGMLGVEPPVVKQQRRGIGAVCAVGHSANKNHMVAFCITAAVDALKMRCCTFNQRCAAEALAGGNAVEAVRAGAGKAQRQVFLVSRQYVDGVVCAAGEKSQRAGVLCQAPQHQRRRKRDRVERVGGKSQPLAVWRARGDDGYACGKHAQGGAKFACAKRRRQRWGRAGGQAALRSGGILCGDWHGIAVCHSPPSGAVTAATRPGKCVPTRPSEPPHSFALRSCARAAA